jgi:predicted negative regulator of RcsB-dependent stress response
MSSLPLTEKDVTTKKDDDIARIVSEIYSLKVALAKHERPWFRRSSVVISVLALLFSLGTTGVSYWHTHQQDIHDARSELRTLIQRLNHLPIEDLEYSRKYENEPKIYGRLSGLLNSENAVIAKQAADVIDRIPSNVSATEYSAVANALIQSALK